MGYCLKRFLTQVEIILHGKIWINFSPTILYVTTTYTTLTTLHWGHRNGCFFKKNFIIIVIQFDDKKWATYFVVVEYIKNGAQTGL